MQMKIEEIYPVCPFLFCAEGIQSMNKLIMEIITMHMHSVRT